MSFGEVPTDGEQGVDMSHDERYEMPARKMGESSAMVIELYNNGDENERAEALELIKTAADKIIGMANMFNDARMIMGRQVEIVKIYATETDQSIADIFPRIPLKELFETGLITRDEAKAMYAIRKANESDII